MRWLIDGYNVMHAGGRLGAKLSREGFRRARRRFLDELSTALGPDPARQTTVVFDASVHPGDFALDAEYRGLGILFALGDENADARIEQLIAADSNPRDAHGRLVRSPHSPGGQPPPKPSRSQPTSSGSGSTTSRNEVASRPKQRLPPSQPATGPAPTGRRVGPLARSLPRHR